MRHFFIALGIAATSISPAFAESGMARLDNGETVILGEEVDVSARVVVNSLGHAGYSQVRFMERENIWVSAFDREGSEVILHISAQTGEIIDSRYVHPMDQ